MGTVSNRKSASRARGVRKTRVSDARTETSVTRPSGPNYPLVLWLSAIGALVSLFLIPLLSERPGERSAASRAGGESVVEKSPAGTAIRGSIPAIPSEPAPETGPPVAPRQFAPAPSEPSVTASIEPDGLSEDGAISTQGLAAQAMMAPAINPAGDMPFSQDSGAQQALQSAPATPLPERAPEKPSTAQAEPPDNAPQISLPWQSGDTGARNETQLAALPPEASEPVDLPGRSEIRGWARSAAREFVGGVDADGMPLYRFDVWLDAPENIRAQIRSVTYEYRAPSAKPSAQSSSDTGSGFRVKFGAAACAEKATITVVMKDGQERSVDVNGCRILN